MMRLTCATALALLFSVSAFAQQPTAGGVGQIPGYAIQSSGSPASTGSISQANQGAPNEPLAKIASQEEVAKRAAEAMRRTQQMAQQQGLPVVVNPAAVPNDSDRQPFPPLNAAAQEQLQQLLLAWEKTSQETKTLQCTFERWHFDLFAAPAGVHATKAEGEIRYAAPDKGVFKVESLVFFKGMDGGKPNFAAQPGQFGEYWVCNGKELMEFDRGKKECRIQTLPPEMRGQYIFNSPLPFVFNLDAEQIQNRYWVRQVASPKPGTLLIEAWPKTQADRAQYKMVQIALDASTYLPEALVMYAPNFNAKQNPKWDHYEFANQKRNSLRQGWEMFVKSFLDRPPKDWKVIQESFMADDTQQAQAVPTSDRR